MNTITALIAILIGSILSDGFTWFEATLASFIFVIAILSDLNKIGKEYLNRKKQTEQFKNELIESMEKDDE